MSYNMYGLNRAWVVYDFPEKSFSSTRSVYSVVCVDK